LLTPKRPLRPPKQRHPSRVPVCWPGPMTAGPPRKPPPPLPPQARTGARPSGLVGGSRQTAAPPPSAPPSIPRGEAMSQAIKDQISEMALGILEEQVQARIVHYRADLETNPELDGITAQVVASLK